ncbi:MAG TPA: ACP phosphodiesterase [Nevskiaceae bacterium]|nr:ACP phosphodiesterase [Nevskiaceae bacterium]
MNFLAHLRIADATHTSLAGAILGDVVHGRLEALALPADIELGIRIHRRVDFVTDTHPLSHAWRDRFPRPQRRYAGIVLDLLCDHVLANDWQQYSGEPLGAFATRCGIAVSAQAGYFARYGRWEPHAERFAALLCSYVDRAGFERAVTRTASRLRHPAPLIEAAQSAPALVASIRADLPTLLQALDIAAVQIRDEAQRALSRMPQASSASNSASR